MQLTYTCISNKLPIVILHYRISLDMIDDKMYFFYLLSLFLQAKKELKGQRLEKPEDEEETISKMKVI